MRKKPKTRRVDPSQTRKPKIRVINPCWMELEDREIFSAYVQEHPKQEIFPAQIEVIDKKSRTKRIRDKIYTVKKNGEVVKFKLTNKMLKARRDAQDQRSLSEVLLDPTVEEENSSEGISKQSQGGSSSQVNSQDDCFYIVDNESFEDGNGEEDSARIFKLLGSLVWKRGQKAADLLAYEPAASKLLVKQLAPLRQLKRETIEDFGKRINSRRERARSGFLRNIQAGYRAYPPICDLNNGAAYSIIPHYLEFEFHYLLWMDQLLIRNRGLTRAQFLIKIENNKKQAILLDIFDNVLQGKPLTTDLRVALSHALSSTLKKHVFDKGLVHRDLKPENLILRIINLGNLRNPRFKVIDWDTPKNAKTLGYSSSAVFTRDYNATQKDDINTTGLILFRIWGASPLPKKTLDNVKTLYTQREFEEARNLIKPAKAAQKKQFEDFLDSTGLKKEHKEKIKTICTRAANFENPNARPDFDEIYHCFATLMKEINSNPAFGQLYNSQEPTPKPSLTDQVLEQLHLKTKEQRQAQHIWEKVIAPAVKDNRKIGLLYSANNNQAEAIMRAYADNSFPPLHGKGQALLFAELIKLIKKYGKEEQVRIIPVATSLHGGDNPDENIVSKEIIDRDLANIAQHLGEGYTVWGLEKDGEFALGGGQSWWWEKSGMASIARKNRKDKDDNIILQSQHEYFQEHLRHLRKLQGKENLRLFSYTQLQDKESSESLSTTQLQNKESSESSSTTQLKDKVSSETLPASWVQRTLFGIKQTKNTEFVSLSKNEQPDKLFKISHKEIDALRTIQEGPGFITFNNYSIVDKHSQIQSKPDQPFAHFIFKSTEEFKGTEDNGAGVRIGKSVAGTKADVDPEEGKSDSDATNNTIKLTLSDEELVKFQDFYFRLAYSRLAAYQSQGVRIVCESLMEVDPSKLGIKYNLRHEYQNDQVSKQLISAQLKAIKVALELASRKNNHNFPFERFIICSDQCEAAEFKRFFYPESSKNDFSQLSTGPFNLTMQSPVRRADKEQKNNPGKKVALGLDDDDSRWQEDLLFFHRKIQKYLAQKNLKEMNEEVRATDKKEQTKEEQSGKEIEVPKNKGKNKDNNNIETNDDKQNDKKEKGKEKLEGNEAPIESQDSEKKSKHSKKKTKNASVEELPKASTLSDLDSEKKIKLVPVEEINELRAQLVSLQNLMSSFVSRFPNYPLSSIFSKGGLTSQVENLRSKLFVGMQAEDFHTISEQLEVIRFNFKNAIYSDSAAALYSKNTSDSAIEALIEAIKNAISNYRSKYENRFFLPWQSISKESRAGVTCLEELLASADKNAGVMRARLLYTEVERIVATHPNSPLSQELATSMVMINEDAIKNIRIQAELDSKVISFLGGKARIQPDAESNPDLWLSASELLMLGDNELEQYHSYIEWQYPNKDQSEAVKNAPIWTDEDIERIRNPNEPYRRQLLSHLKWGTLPFFGFKLVANANSFEILRTADFKDRAENWIINNKHNLLRITRILKCWDEINPLVSEALREQLKTIASDPVYVNHISDETWYFWRIGKRYRSTPIPSGEYYLEREFVSALKDFADAGLLDEVIKFQNNLERRRRPHGKTLAREGRLLIAIKQELGREKIQSNRTFSTWAGFKDHLVRTPEVDLQKELPVILHILPEALRLMKENHLQQQEERKKRQDQSTEHTSENNIADNTTGTVVPPANLNIEAVPPKEEGTSSNDPKEKPKNADIEKLKTLANYFGLNLYIKKERDRSWKKIVDYPNRKHDLHFEINKNGKLIYKKPEYPRDDYFETARKERFYIFTGTDTLINKSNQLINPEFILPFLHSVDQNNHTRWALLTESNMPLDQDPTFLDLQGAERFKHKPAYVQQEQFNTANIAQKLSEYVTSVSNIKPRNITEQVSQALVNTVLKKEKWKHIVHFDVNANNVTTSHEFTLSEYTNFHFTFGKIEIVMNAKKLHVQLSSFSPRDFKFFSILMLLDRAQRTPVLTPELRNLGIQQINAPRFYRPILPENIVLVLPNSDKNENDDAPSRSVIETAGFKVINTDTKPTTQKHVNKTTQMLLKTLPASAKEDYRKFVRVQHLTAIINKAILGRATLKSADGSEEPEKEDPENKLSSYLGRLASKTKKTAGITWVSEWHHGKRGIKRAENYLKIVNDPQTDLHKILEKTKELFSQSKQRDDSLCDYLKKAFKELKPSTAEKNALDGLPTLLQFMREGDLSHKASVKTAPVYPKKAILDPHGGEGSTTSVVVT